MATEEGVAGASRGVLLAQGRDSEIFEAGPGRVLRRARDGRSLEREAEVMRHVRAQGYPAPEVFGLSSDGSELTMERVDGPTMLTDLETRHWRLHRHATTLANLHDRLHEIRAPEWMDDAAGPPGDRVVHLDLHPLNVIMSQRGPVVIDWTNGRRGDPLFDVALTWILLGGAQLPTTGLKRHAVRAVRGLYLTSFLGALDRAGAASRLEAAVSWKSGDRNMSEDEIEAMRAVARANSGAS